LKPEIGILVENHIFEGHNFLLIRIPKHDASLVMTASGKCYIRSGRDSRPMTPLEVEERIKSLTYHDWSCQTIEAIDWEDALDDIGIELAYGEYYNLNKLGEPKIPTEHFLEAIGITVDGKLTKGGLLFLGKSLAISKVIGKIEFRFSKLIKGDALAINEIWDGSIWNAITKIKSLFKKVVSYSQFNYDGKAYTFPSINEVSLEEAMINSFVHRDYTVDGMTCIEFKPDHVTFTNPGKFYGGITSENIFTHPPRHRNKALAKILMNFNLVDRAGMGTRRMNRDALMLGRSKPHFNTENENISVSLELNSIKKGVFILSLPYEDYDVVELLLINSLYESGCKNINSVICEVKPITNEPWSDIKKALRRIDFLSLVGNNDGIYIVANDSHREVLKASKTIKTDATSNDYVSIFDYLQENKKASSNKLSAALNIGSLDKAQQLLEGARFISKEGDGVNTTWALI